MVLGVWTSLNVLLLLLSITDVALCIFGNQCAKNPNLDVEAPGNTYFCPFENPDGTTNVYTECCYNDRPDESGNYYSCCKTDEDQESERNSQLRRTVLIIGGVAAILFTCVFIFTYCRADTFPFVERVKSRVIYWWRWLSDHVCFCMCFKKSFQREEKNKEVEVAVQDDTRFDLW